MSDNTKDLTIELENTKKQLEQYKTQLRNIKKKVALILEKIEQDA